MTEPVTGSGVVARAIEIVTAPFFILREQFRRLSGRKPQAQAPLPRLGKRPLRVDKRTLKLASYLPATLPPLPDKVDWTKGETSFGMMLNDKLGCCTIAALGHAVQTWTLNASGSKYAPLQLTVPDSTILEYYERWDGYDPNDPSSDQGGVELDVLKRFRKEGFSNISLDAFSAIHLDASAYGIALSRTACFLQDHRVSLGLLAQAIALFGGAYIGVELPVRAQNQDVWDVPATLDRDQDAPGSWGGHAIWLVGFEAENGRPVRFTCITWGSPKVITAAWMERYCSEAYALLSKAWLNSNQVAPSQIDYATLQKDISALG